jgi:hypothetical protein
MCHRRSEIGIVKAALDDRLFLDEDLVFPPPPAAAPVQASFKDIGLDTLGISDPRHVPEARCLLDYD